MFISQEALKELLKDQAIAYGMAIRALEGHVESVKAQNQELHDRLMAQNYQEFAIGRLDKSSLAGAGKPAPDREDPEEHKVGSIVYEDEEADRG